MGLPIPSRVTVDSRCFCCLNIPRSPPRTGESISVSERIRRIFFRTVEQDSHPRQRTQSISN